MMFGNIETCSENSKVWLYFLKYYFLTNNHTTNDISHTCIPLELIHCNRDSVRKAREAYFINIANTLEPLGLNKKDEM